MSSVVDHATKDHLDTKIIAHDRNRIIMISIMISFMLCLCIMDFINLFKIAINSFIYQMNINVRKMCLV